MTLAPLGARRAAPENGKGKSLGDQTRLNHKIEWAKPSCARFAPQAQGEHLPAPAGWRYAVLDHAEAQGNAAP
ncbi:hypothetical protein GCM10008024_26970 [Allgaiera indica]|uniref:Uncharacterized protein n=1 Tax=Allgaiera indica TaxID=765699 RepID=A0AAN5A024_9RHOB|nr:hypothetical protein GCM10008024_26970 [Allgaiera indica]